MCISFFDVVSIKIEPKQVSESVYGTEVRGVLVFDDIRGRKKYFVQTRVHIWLS